MYCKNKVSGQSRKLQRRDLADVGRRVSVAIIRFQRKILDNRIKAEHNVITEL